MIHGRHWHCALRSPGRFHVSISTIVISSTPWSAVWSISTLPVFHWPTSRPSTADIPKVPGAYRQRWITSGSGWSFVRSMVTCVERVPQSGLVSAGVGAGVWCGIVAGCWRVWQIRTTAGGCGRGWHRFGMTRCAARVTRRRAWGSFGCGRTASLQWSKHSQFSSVNFTPLLSSIIHRFIMIIRPGKRQPNQGLVWSGAVALRSTVNLLELTGGGTQEAKNSTFLSYVMN